MLLDALLSDIFRECSGSHEVMLEAVAKYLSRNSSLYSSDYKTLISNIFSKYEDDNLTKEDSLDQTPTKKSNKSDKYAKNSTVKDLMNASGHSKTEFGFNFPNTGKELALNSTEIDASSKQMDSLANGTLRLGGLRRDSDIFRSDEDIFIPETQEIVSGGERSDVDSDSNDFIQINHDTSPLNNFQDDLQSQNLFAECELNGSLIAARLSCINNRTNDSISLTSTHISRDLIRAQIEPSDMEMSELKWNDTAENITEEAKRISLARDTLINGNRSTSTTPDLDIDSTSNDEPHNYDNELKGRTDDEEIKVSEKEIRKDSNVFYTEKNQTGAKDVVEHSEKENMAQKESGQDKSTELDIAVVSDKHMIRQSDVKIFEASVKNTNDKSFNKSINSPDSQKATKDNDIEREVSRKGHKKTEEEEERKRLSTEQIRLNLTQSSDKDNQSSASHKSNTSNNLEANDDEHDVYNMATQILPTNEAQDDLYNMATQIIPTNEAENDLYNMATQILPTTSTRTVEYSYTNNKENEVADFDAPTQTFVSPKDIAGSENNRNDEHEEEDIYMRETQVFALPKPANSKFKLRKPTANFMKPPEIKITKENSQRNEVPDDDVSIYNMPTQCITIPEDEVMNLICGVPANDDCIYNMQTQVFPSTSFAHNKEQDEAPEVDLTSKISVQKPRKSEDRKSPDTQEDSIAKCISKDIGELVEKRVSEKQKKSKPLKKTWLFVSSSDEEGIDELMNDDVKLYSGLTKKSTKESKGGKTSSELNSSKLSKSSKISETKPPLIDTSTKQHSSRSTKRRNSVRNIQNLNEKEDEEPVCKKSSPIPEDTRKSKRGRDTVPPSFSRAKVVLTKMEKPISENIQPTKEFNKSSRQRATNTSEENPKERLVSRSGNRESAKDISFRSNTSDQSTDSNSSSRRAHRTLKPQIMFTRVDFSEIDYRQIVEKMGAKVVVDINACTVLVTNKIVRTCKFLCALAKGVPIVSPEWLLAIKNNRNKIIDTEKFILKDPETEHRFKFKLRSTLDLAQQSPLLKDYVIFVTPNVQPPPGEIKEMVQCAGGKCYTNYSEHSKQAISRMFVVSAKEDKQSWAKYRSFYSKIPIISSEGLMLSIMRHQKVFNEFVLCK